MHAKARSVHRRVLTNRLVSRPPQQRDARMTLPRRRHRARRLRPDAFDNNFYMCDVRCRSPPGSSPQHRPSSHAAIFLRTRALPSTARFPHDFLAHSAAFTAEPPGVSRVLAAGPPLAAACTCSRALRLLGSSARPRLRLLRALHSADMSLSVFLSKSRGGATHRSGRSYTDHENRQKTGLVLADKMTIPSAKPFLCTFSELTRARPH